MAADAPSTSLDPAATAAEALRLVGDEPARAVRVADALIASAEPSAAVSTAWRARGLAHRELGQLDTALADLREAVRVAEEAGGGPAGAGAPGAGQAAGEARMSLVSVLAERGEMAAALDESDRALAQLAGLPAARMRVQRGTFYGRVGRFADAIAEYEQALPSLRRDGDGLWEARVLNNLSIARAYRGEFTSAATDLVRAEELFLAAGQPLDAADACWNRGFVASRLGDVPLALTLFDTAEARFAAHGVPVPEIFLGRSEVLLSVGLHAEALANAERALDTTASGRGSLWAEAHLALAQAALAIGDRGRARTAASAAADLFQQQERQPWAVVARYVQLRCEEATDEVDEDAVLAAIATADELGRGGWAAQELDARIIAARFALRRGDTTRGRHQLQRASAAKQSGAMNVRARAWHAEALLRLAHRDRAGAEQALEAGLHALDQHRATLGATELRVHTAIHGEELASMGLKLALADGAPVEVLRWVERWRAGALRWRPARPPEDAIFAGLLAELRHVGAEEERQRLDGLDSRQQRRARQELERKVLHHNRQSVGAGAGAVAVDPDTLSAALGDRALVEYLSFGGRLSAVTIRAGEVALHDLGAADDVEQVLDQLRFALRGLGCGTGSLLRSGARDLLTAQAAILDDRLIRPVLGVIGDAELVLVPSAVLRDVPWAFLPSCVGRPVSVVPSAMLWLRAGGARADSGGRVVLVGGPGLAGGDSEVERLATVYPRAALLRGGDATAAAVLDALDGAGVAHIAAHGSVRADNPYFSALHVHDGPLTVFDLERLGTPPELVVLPACQSGVTVARPGDEMLGLAAALLALGSRCLIGSVAPVPDRGTTELMTVFHDRLRTGEQPAHALAAAQQALHSTADHDLYAAVASFACYGAGS